MFDFTYELEQLEKGDRSPGLIKRLIDKHSKRAAVMKKLYERYKTTDVPIFHRELEDPMKINNQINNDYFSEIVDVKVGYFAGVAASYKYEKEGVTNDSLQDFITRNRIADLNAETTKYAAICGYGVRFIYIDQATAKERVAILKPWESILISESGLDETKYAVRYFTVDLGDKQELRAELFEAGKSIEFRGPDVDKLEVYEEKDHVFDFCPIWGYENNEELQGDAEKVLPAIDAVDRTTSDINSEIEAYRSAYLAFYGVEAPSEEEEQSFAANGTFYFRDGQKGEFITKNIQDAAVENHLNRLEKAIYRFSKTPDMSDEAFGGNVSGVAMEYKMLSLENKTSTFERKFISADIRQFEILGSAYKKRRIELDPYAIEVKHTRNFPEDYLYEAQVSKELKGLVSELTRLGLLSFVEDAQKEKDAMDEDKAAYAEEFGEMTGGATDESVGGTRPTDTKEAI